MVESGCLVELSKVIYARACSNSRYIRRIFWDRYVVSSVARIRKTNRPSL